MGGYMQPPGHLHTVVNPAATTPQQALDRAALALAVLRLAKARVRRRAGAHRGGWTLCSRLVWRKGGHRLAPVTHFWPRRLAAADHRAHAHSGVLIGGSDPRDGCGGGV